MAIDFAGVKRLDSVGGGCIKAYWRHATSDVGVEAYGMYIAKDEADVFQSEYHWCDIPYRNHITSVIFRTEADSSTFLREGNEYYIGIKAIESTGINDDNSYVKAHRVVGDGSVSVEAPDRKIAKAV